MRVNIFKCTCFAHVAGVPKFAVTREHANCRRGAVRSVLAWLARALVNVYRTASHCIGYLAVTLCPWSPITLRDCKTDILCSTKMYVVVVFLKVVSLCNETKHFPRIRHVTTNVHYIIKTMIEQVRLCV